MSSMAINIIYKLFGKTPFEDWPQFHWPVMYPDFRGVEVAHIRVPCQQHRKYL